MKVKMLGNNIGVEPLGKSKKKDSGFLVMPEAQDSSGVIRFLGEDYEGKLQVGTIICYGDSKKAVKLSGKEILVMSPDNIYAILEEDNEEQLELIYSR
jgi:co-chaperonin GroES (HSP10)